MNHGPGLTFRFLAAQVLVVVISGSSGFRVH